VRSYLRGRQCGPWLVAAALAACGAGRGPGEVDADSDGGAPPPTAPGDAAPGDAAPAPADVAALPCDPIVQTGCPSGRACLLMAGQLVCGAAGDTPEFGRCDPAAGPDPCTAGTICRQTHFGDYRCARFCANDGGCGQGGRCNDEVPASVGPALGLCTRTDECDVQSQDCQDQSQGCYRSFVGDFCLPPGTVADGASCSLPNDCRRGSLCLVVNGGAATCRRLLAP
jgi:hypothetical protein